MAIEVSISTEDESDEWGTGITPDPNEHCHTYKHDDGTEQTLVINKSHVPVQEAVEHLEITEDE